MAPRRVRVARRAEAHVAFGIGSRVEAVRAGEVTPVEEHTAVVAQAEALKVRHGGQRPLLLLAQGDELVDAILGLVLHGSRFGAIVLA